MPLVTKRPLKKAGGVRKRRRAASVLTRAKYVAKTPSNNRSLIRSNARMLASIRRNMPTPVRTDYQQLNTLLCVASSSGDPPLPFSVTSQGRKLTNFSGWNSVMRQSLVVANKSSTTVYRMAINYRVTLQQSYWAQVSFFIVTLRKDSANRNFDGAQVLSEPFDYIANRVGADEQNVQQLQQNPRLNPAVFKVHHVHHMTLAQGGYLQDPTQFQGSDVVSNAFGTYRKGTVNLKMRLRVRNPVTQQNWTTIPFEQLPYYQKYYIITLCNQQSELDANPNNLVVTNVDTLISCVNSG